MELLASECGLPKNLSLHSNIPDYMHNYELKAGTKVHS